MVTSATPINTPDSVPKAVETPLDIAWARFKSEYPTRIDCEEAIFVRAFRAGAIKCPRCGHGDVAKRYGERIVCCMRCGKRWSFTSGTFFDRMRDANLWWGAIWLSQEGIEANASQFQSLVGNAYASGWNVFQKIALAVASREPAQCEKVSSSLFAELICKRSRETPARSHPSAEEEVRWLHGPDSDNTPDFGAVNAPGGDAHGAATASAQEADSEELLTDKDKQILACLSEKPVPFDVLCARLSLSTADLSLSLVMLELNQYLNRLPDDSYVLAASKKHERAADVAAVVCDASAKLLATTVKIITNSGREIYHGISRKYLQPYVARFWLHIDRERWRGDAVINACLEFGPISYLDIVAYVTPATINLYTCHVNTS